MSGDKPDTNNATRWAERPVKLISLFLSLAVKSKNAKPLDGGACVFLYLVHRGWVIRVNWLDFWVDLADSGDNWRISDARAVPE